jgi:hypothetical protein
MTGKRILSVAVIALIVAGSLAPAAFAAEQRTVLNYSIKDARAFLWQIHYPQATFVTEKYSPCNAETDKYNCDRTRYNQEPGSCPKAEALGRLNEAPETPTPDDLQGAVGPTDVTDNPGDFPVGNPVSVIHGLAMGRLSSSPESGGMSSMYYVDNSGRRETEAHVESDGFVGNRNDYEERCAVVDAASESSMYPGPFAAHMLSRATQQPSTYNMAAFTTAEASPFPPGQSKESVAIVKLWEADGKVHGLLSSTVRGVTLADQITIDVVRSIISFSSDGTEKGLTAAAKTEALGVRIAGTKIGGLSANDVIPLGEDNYLGVVSPMVQTVNEGHQLIVRAPGVFLAAHTTLDQLPIPEDPFNQEPLNMLPGAEQLKGNLTLGGKFYPDQVVYVAGALLNAGLSRIPEFSLGPLPPIPRIPQPPGFKPPVFTPPTFTGGTVAPPVAPVAQARYVTRELAGSAWTLAIIVAFTMLGLLGVMGRWSMRFAWAQKVAQAPPFPAFSWVYRAFLKG